MKIHIDHEVEEYLQTSPSNAERSYSTQCRLAVHQGNRNGKFWLMPENDAHSKFHTSMNGDYLVIRPSEAEARNPGRDVQKTLNQLTG